MANLDSVRSIINAATDAIDNSFDDLVIRTRRSFRPSRHASPFLNSHRRSARGRRKSEFWVPPRSIFLLRLANAEYMPQLTEQRKLQSYGLGFTNENEIKFQRSWNFKSIEEYIASLFPRVPLNLVGFRFAKCNKSRELLTLKNISSVDDLEKEIKKGVIIILPNRDIPYNDNENMSEPITEGISNLPREDLSESSDDDFIRNGPSRRGQNNNQSSEDISLISELIQDNKTAEEDLDVEESATTGDGDEINAIVYPSLPEHAATIEMFVSRQNIFENVLEFYRNDNNNSSRLHVTFLGENGIDLGGLTKEMFMLFWSSAREKHYFHGENVCVPFLPLHKNKEKNNFKIMGTILSHTLALVKCLPIEISRTTLVLLSNIDSENLDNEFLLSEFLLFVTISERRLILKGINFFEKLNSNELSRLQNLFVTHSFMENPTKHKFREQILLLAENILLLQPKLLVDKIKAGIPEFSKPMFETLNLDTINKLWKSNHPTPTKVCNLLKMERDDATNEEVKIFFYLQNYIESSNNDRLQKFLLFVTGAVTMPKFPIIISFQTDQIEFGRRPIAHTCSTSLQLPLSYSSQQEFSREMDIFMSDESSFEFSII